MKKIVLYFVASLMLILPFGCSTSRNLASKALVDMFRIPSIKPIAERKDSEDNCIVETIGLLGSIYKKMMINANGERNKTHQCRTAFR